MRKALLQLIACSTVLFAAPRWAAGQTGIGEPVVFGDSLSDPGNLFALTRTNNVPPSYDVDAVLVPSAAYAEGGHHLSNGPTWIEDLARSRALAAYVGPAWRESTSPAANYAIAAARAHNDGAPIPGFSVQVGRFLQDVGGSAASTALYVVEFGGNDIRDALTSGAPSIVTLAVTSISDNIEALYGAGARRFLVLNAPNMSLLPSIRAFGPAAAAAAGQLTLLFNGSLSTALANLQNQHTDIQIVQFNLYAALTNIYRNPSAFGLTEVNAPCITPDVAPYKCINPDEYLFWDGIHPTKAVHAVLAQQVGDTLPQ
jgi:phospholipase/lecithinase/hemolysin